MRNIQLFFQLTRPAFVLGVALLYALGAGVADYLGATINWQLYLLGQAWVTLIQLSAHFFDEFFGFRFEQENPNRSLFSRRSGALGEQKLARETALWAGVVCLTIAASLTVVLVRAAQPGLDIILIMVLIFAGAFFYAVPPVRLVSSGYGELTTAIVAANLAPALAFLLQFGELHRLLAMAAFPLTFLSLAMLIVFELPEYASDVKFGRQNLLVKLGWERGMLLHNVLVPMSYLVLGLGVLLGMPVALAFPAMLAFPLGIFHIWMLNRIADGAKPNWPALTLSAAALLGITAYLLTFAFWTQ